MGLPLLSSGPWIPRRPRHRAISRTSVSDRPGRDSDRSPQLKRSAPCRTPDGEPLTAALSPFGYTERKRAEESLRQLNATLESRWPSGRRNWPIGPGSSRN